MEKKIKSVKLKTNGLIIPTLKFRESDRHWYLNDLQWSEENILSGRLNDLFEIEYEPERKKIQVEFIFSNEEDYDIDSNWLVTALNEYCRLKDFKAYFSSDTRQFPTQSTWTDAEVKAFVKYFYNDSDDAFEKFKAERKSELGK